MIVRTWGFQVVALNLVCCLPTTPLDSYTGDGSEQPGTEVGPLGSPAPFALPSASEPPVENLDSAESSEAADDAANPADGTSTPSSERAAESTLPLANQQGEGASNQEDPAGAEPERAPPSQPAGVEPPTTCITGARSADGARCFLSPFGFATWQGAQAECEALGGNLARVDTPQDDAIVGDLVFASVWLGASDTVQEGLLAWTDGTPVDFGNWGLGQPDEFPSTDCVEKRFEPFQRWYDQPCNNVRRYICEHPLPGE